ncbi:MAG TPA: hypothetical protein VN709_00380, partial [Terriglobales bacterium]|nr:hypothetical protein [Terriglobales bacterium]
MTLKNLLPRGGQYPFSPLLLLVIATLACLAPAQRERAGHSLGSVAVRGKLIVVTLNQAALGSENLFDLDRRTLRFTPSAAGYSVENLPLQWDDAFGDEASASQVTLRNFAFPFAGRDWNDLSVGANGSIAFGAPAAGRGGARGRGRGGVVLQRYDEMQVADKNLAKGQPAICVLLRVRWTGKRYVKEMADRVLITWDLSEPYAGIQDWTWHPTVNRFQAVLHADGTIEMSYNHISARDGIVGVYPGSAAADSTRGEVHFAAIRTRSGPYPSVFEGFHYLKPTDPRDLACTVIGALGDHYDDLAYYSDFRVDNPEAGTPSEGPRGPGPGGVPVSGIGGRGARAGNLADYCTQGRFQWGFVQPIDADANQMQPQPPPDVMDANLHNIMAYQKQLGEIAGNGRMPPYEYAISQIGHEMEHRWSAFARAQVDGKMVDLGPTHWARGLQAQVPFPYQRPVEASAMGGGVWQDNFDGTFTQLDDDYYVPPTGYSYLDLYLMGLLAPSEVPDFFLLN